MCAKNEGTDNSSSSMGPPTFICPVRKNNHIIENIPIHIGGDNINNIYTHAHIHIACYGENIEYTGIQE